MRARSLGSLGALAVAMAVASLAAMGWHGDNSDHVRWLAYSALVMGQLARAYANRSVSQSVFHLRLNGFLALACLTGAAIQIAIPFVPPLADAFHASPLDVEEWAIVAAIALAPGIVAEILRRTGRTWVA